MGHSLFNILGLIQVQMARQVVVPLSKIDIIYSYPLHEDWPPLQWGAHTYVSIFAANETHQLSVKQKSISLISWIQFYRRLHLLKPCFCSTYPKYRIFQPITRELSIQKRSEIVKNEHARYTLERFPTDNACIICTKKGIGKYGIMY